MEMVLIGLGCIGSVVYLYWLFPMLKADLGF